MTTFPQLGVPRDISDALASTGIITPFPIQEMTIPDGIAGRDVSGRASTGSGKTLAFGIPLVANDPRGRPRRPAALVLVPTRELAAQVADVLAPLAAARGRSVATFYGGTKIARDQRRLRHGVDIAIACPGRLADLTRRGDVDLRDVRTVVVDEADRMADMGFLPEVRWLLDKTASDRQTLLFSATLDGDVDVLVRRYQNDPVRHELATADEERGDVRHLFWHAEHSARVGIARDIVSTVGPAIVFTRTKHGADRVAKQLSGKGVRAAAIHGNRSQNQRERALADLNGGRISTLVATDVAARGIHVDNVGVVVHFDPPTTDKDYVHRSGRTGRAGADGVVVTLVSPDKAKDVRGLQRALSLHQRVDDVDLDDLTDVSSGVGTPSMRRPSPSGSGNGSGSAGKKSGRGGRPSKGKGKGGQGAQASTPRGSGGARRSASRRPSGGGNASGARGGRSTQRTR